MRENRLSGSEGGGTTRSPYPYCHSSADADLLNYLFAKSCLDEKRESGVVFKLRASLPTAFQASAGRGRLGHAKAGHGPHRRCT